MSCGDLALFLAFGCSPNVLLLSPMMGDGWFVIITNLPFFLTGVCFLWFDVCHT